MAYAEVQLFRSYISASVEAGLWLFTIPVHCSAECALGEKIGVASVILQPTKTVISLAAMSSLQATMPCFITLMLTPLNRTITTDLAYGNYTSSAQP